MPNRTNFFFFYSANANKRYIFRVYYYAQKNKKTSFRIFNPENSWIYTINVLFKNFTKFLKLFSKKIIDRLFGEELEKIFLSPCLNNDESS